VDQFADGYSTELFTVGKVAFFGQALSMVPSLTIFHARLQSCRLRGLNRPNDVVVKSDGAIYFTDPRLQRTDGISRTRNFFAIA
jgi:glucose/arabinose dehydrogenase